MPQRMAELGASAVDSCVPSRVVKYVYPLSAIDWF